MKRLLCIVLAVMMCLSLLSCGEKPVQDETPPPVTDVTDDPVTDEEIETEEEEEPPVDPKTIWNGTLTHGGEGFYDPERDYSANPRYKVCYYITYSSVFNDKVSSALEHWCSLMNIEYAGMIMQANHPDDRDAQLRELAAEYDGIILSEDYECRYSTILDEEGCPWILKASDMRWGDYPAVIYAYNNLGKELAERVVGYFEENMTDISAEETGVLYITYSGLDVITTREEQFKEALKNIFPVLYENIVTFDVNHPWDIASFDPFYDEVFANNPQYKQWICIAMSSNDIEHATSAFERNGFSDSSYIFCTLEVPDVWVDNDYNACCAVYTSSVVLDTEPVIGALYGFMTGELNPETIWGGDENGCGTLELSECVWVTRENYKDYLAKMNEYLGGEFYAVE